MSLLIPAGLMDAARSKVAISSGITTISSNSIAAAGTNLVQVPFYAWISAFVSSGAFACYNGTGGSTLFRGTTVVGGQELQFWTNPGGMAANKPLVIETTGEVGIHEFHVYAAVVRGGSPSDPLGQ